ncbi:MAG: site-specific integrase [Oscillospiraceae bacterium]
MATIKKRGKGYLFRVYAGYDSNGKQIEKTKTWTPPPAWSEKRAEKEALHQAALFEEQVRTGAVVGGKIKFADFAQRWFTEYAESRLRPRTVARYKELINRVNSELGHMPLDRIRPTHLLEFYRHLECAEPKNATYQCTCDLKEKLHLLDMTQIEFSKRYHVSLTTLSTAWHRAPVSRRSAEKISEGLHVPLDAVFEPCNPEKTISSTTVQHYHSLVSSILTAAVNWQYIPYNPCSRVAPPKAASPDVAYLDDGQSKRLLKLLQSEPGMYRRAISLLLLTGLRRGELLGLEWKDIDFKNRTLTISRTSQYLPKRGVYTDEPKNKSSRRLVLISTQVVLILQEQQRWQAFQASQLGNGWDPCGRIITGEDGSPLHPDRLTRWFAKFIQRTDLPPVHIHSLRHTYATLCIAQGVPITAVAAQMGHANVATTATIYAHAIKSAQIAAADKIGGLFEDVL